MIKKIMIVIIRILMTTFIQFGLVLHFMWPLHFNEQSIILLMLISGITALTDYNLFKRLKDIDFKPKTALIYNIDVMLLLPNVLMWLVVFAAKDLTLCSNYDKMLNLALCIIDGTYICERLWLWHILDRRRLLANAASQEKE